MSTSTTIPSPFYRLTLEQYEAMVASGVLSRRDRVHLINGSRVARMTHNPPQRVADELCCVVRGTIVAYETRHPDPHDIALVVEVAGSRLSADRRMGAEVYGPSGIPAYWIVNLIQRQVEVHTDPGPEGYRSRVDDPEGQSIPVVIDGEPLGQIAVADALPLRPVPPTAEGNGA